MCFNIENLINLLIGSSFTQLHRNPGWIQSGSCTSGTGHPQLHSKADPALCLTHIFTLDSKGWRLMAYSWILFSSSMASWWLWERKGNEFDVSQTDIAATLWMNSLIWTRTNRSCWSQGVFGGNYLDLCVQLPQKWEFGSSFPMGTCLNPCFNLSAATALGTGTASKRDAVNKKTLATLTDIPAKLRTEWQLLAGKFGRSDPSLGNCFETSPGTQWHHCHKLSSCN